MKKYDRETYNPEMIILAREFRGLTQKELAAKSGLTQAKIAKIENGVQGVSEDMILSFVKVLDLPIDFFKQRKKIYPSPLSIKWNDYLNKY